MKRRGTYGTSYRALGALGRARGLGAIDAAQQSVLLSNAETLWGFLDALGARVNDAAAAGVDDQVLAALRTERDTLRADLQRLSDRIEVLNTQADIGAWEAAYNEVRARAVQLLADVQRLLGEERSAQLRRVGLWVGGATLGTVGLVLLVRWYARRRRR